MNETLKCQNTGWPAPVDAIPDHKSCYCTTCTTARNQNIQEALNTRTPEAAELLPTNPEMEEEADRYFAEHLLNKGTRKIEAAEPVACSRCSGPENVCDALQHDDVRSCPCKCHNTLAEILCPSCDGNGVDVSAPDDAGVGGDVDECPTCGGDGTLIGTAKSPYLASDVDALLERLRRLKREWRRRAYELHDHDGPNGSAVYRAVAGDMRTRADELERAMEGE